MEEDNIKKISFEQSIYYTQINIPNNILVLSKSIELTKDNINYNNYHTVKKEDLIKGEELIKFLNDPIINLINKYNYKKFNITKWWLQKYEKNQYHDLHMHGTEKDWYSIILYLDCTKDSSCVNFYSPLYPYVINQSISFKPEKGLLIIFPSYLPHCVPPNNDLQRFIFSANIVCYG